MQPLITVYITNHNYANFIRQAVESVLSQTCQDFELLIIDDGSTDRSQDIIEEYRDHPKVQIIYQKNRGLSYTNNIAMRTAKGKYLVRLDADDFLDPTAIEEMSNVLEKDPEIGLVFPDYYYVDGDGTLIGEVRRHDFEMEVSLYDQAAHGACTMIRLEYLKRLGGYNESFSCQDGYNIWIKFIAHYKVANVTRPLFYYRRHGKNLSNDENRILSTRRKINNWFVNSFQPRIPRTSVIIPVRRMMINSTNWPLYVNPRGITILEEMIRNATVSSEIDTVIVTSEDPEILSVAEGITKRIDKCRVIPRPPELARINEPLHNTVRHVLERLCEDGDEPDLIMTLSLEYPFVNTEAIEDAINTLMIFNADSLISVRPDNRTYYQHNGHGMQPILDQDKFTKLEREALYKGAGGIIVTKVAEFRKHMRMQSGKVGHIIVDQRTAFGVLSEFDLAIYHLLEQIPDASSASSGDQTGLTLLPPD